MYVCVGMSKTSDFFWEQKKNLKGLAINYLISEHKTGTLLNLGGDEWLS